MKKTKVRKRGLRILIILLSIILVIALAGISLVLWDAPARAELKNISIGYVDFGNLIDGVYKGEYRGTKSSLRDAAVEVTVESGAVTKITVIKGENTGDKESTNTAENSIPGLFESVIDSQTLQIDAVSGATLTSNAYLKAIENALLKAQAK